MENRRATRLRLDETQSAYRIRRPALKAVVRPQVGYERFTSILLDLAKQESVPTGPGSDGDASFGKRSADDGSVAPEAVTDLGK